jgi:hypothetical protein
MSATTSPGAAAQESLLEGAREAALVRWDLPFDALIMLLVGALFTGLAAARFSRADNT